MQSAELFTENKIIANKQNAARSGVEQPADIMPVFRIIKKIQPTHTVRDIPVHRCPVKRLISDMFHSENMSFLSLNSLTTIRVPAGTKNSRPVGFLW